MAYNREWDMGKESWHEGGSWGSGSGKGRDEDYVEGKKRKFNSSVCKPFIFHLSLTYNASFLRPGMMADRMPIRATKITVSAEEAVFTAIRSVSSPVIPVHMLSFLASTLVSRNQTFVSLPLSWRQCS
jgi:hypothetical protein